VLTDPRPWAMPGSDEPAADASAAPVPPAPETPADEVEREAEIPLRPLGVSEILDGAVTSIRRNPRATLGMSAILTCVVEVIVTVAQYFFIGSQARNELTPGVLARSVGWAFVTVSAGLLLTAFIVVLLSGLLAPVMARTLLGRPTSFARAWAIARPSLPRLLGVSSSLIGIVILAVAVPFAPLAAAVAADAPTGVQAIAWIFAVPISFVLMVSGYVWFALAAPILIMEQRGVMASLRRSAEIVRGRWWRTFGVLVLSQVIAVLAGFLVLPMPFAVVEQIVLGFNSEPTGWVLVALVAIGAIGRSVAGTLANPFNAGVIAILYADRRMRREAFDLELQMAPPDDPQAAWLPGPLTAAGSGPQPEIPRGVAWPSHTMAPPPPPPYTPPGWPR